MMVSIVRVGFLRSAMCLSGSLRLTRDVKKAGASPCKEDASLPA